MYAHTLRHIVTRLLQITFVISALNSVAVAELTVSHVFGNGMVIQRDQPIRVWGTATPDLNIRVRFASRDLTTKSSPEGNWQLELEALPTSHQPQNLSVQAGKETVEYDNILIGDVWLCGGQSNMEDELENIYHGDTEVASANHAAIRLMTIPQVASPEPLGDIDRINEFNSWTNRYEQKGSWRICTPSSVRRFSAIGYIFGRRLHLVSGVPIGLIDASWGGTTAEAWTSRETLSTVEATRPLTAEWDEKISQYDVEASLQRRIVRWKQDTDRRKQQGKPANPKPTEPEQDPATDRNNPGASFNGMIAPIANFNIKGAIFNQGYNNALGHNARPALYAKTFKAMILDWRKAFRNESLPFGIIALTAGGEPQTLANFEQRQVDPAPFIREAQANAWRALEHVGFAPAHDQQVPWYHPHKKFELGERIARWSLFTHYGQEQLGWQPADCVSWELRGDHIELKFDRRVRVHDGRPFAGFAIAGEDRHFYPAHADFVITGKDDRGRPRKDESRLKVWCEAVAEPKAARYAWARNPLGNAVNSRHHERTIPIVSFRTDDWDWPEAPFAADGAAVNAHRQEINKLRALAKEQNAARIARATSTTNTDAN